MKKIFNLILFIILLFLIIFVGKSELINKYYVNASTDQHFSNNSICVLMQNDLNSFVKEYKTDDFKDVLPDEIYDNNYYLCNKIKNKIINGEINNKNLDEIKNIYRDITLKWNNEKTPDEIINIIKKLESRDDIYCVSPNYLYEFQSNIPNDTYYNSFNNTYTFLNMPDVWNITTGSKNVKVGIIDSGISGNDADLIDNLDNNLHKDFTDQYANQPLVDYLGHGTKVAYTLGAVGNNNYGLCGICWSVSLVSLKVAPSNYAASDLVRQAVDYADYHNIPILNFSAHLSNNGVPINDNNLYLSISNYYGLFVCAAGNQGVNIDSNPAYPANYSMSLNNVITVGGLNSDNTSLYYYGQNPPITIKTNYGSNAVSLFTLGCVNYYDGFICEIHGTSYSSPIVAGAAALLLSIADLSTSQLKQQLLNNCDNLELYNENSDFLCNVKKLNIYKSIKNVLNNLQEHIIQNTSYNYFNEAFELSSSNYDYMNQVFYKLNVIDSALYKLCINSSSNVGVILYDSSFTQISINNCNNIGDKTFYKYLSDGIYYVKIYSLSNTFSIGTFNIYNQLTSLLNYNTENNYTLDNINNLSIKYMNYQSTGYYNITFIPLNPIGTELYEIPDCMLEVYSDVERNNLLFYSSATNNNINVYLEYGYMYYFDIETNISDLSGFKIIIHN